MRVMRLLTPMVLTLALALQGCASDDTMLTFAFNAARPSGGDCLPDSNVYFPAGSLDVNADASVGGVTGPSGANYIADLLMFSEAEVRQTTPPNSPSFPNYGTTDSSSMFIEEVEVRYSFDYAPVSPADVTLAEIPASIVVPVHELINEQTTAGLGRSTFVRAELVPRAVAEALRNDSELLALSLLAEPNTYRILAQFRMRGHHAKGGRFETKDYGYPIELCEGCSALSDPPANECYPPWMNQF